MEDNMVDIMEDIMEGLPRYESRDHSPSTTRWPRVLPWSRSQVASSSRRADSTSRLLETSAMPGYIILGYILEDCLEDIMEDLMEDIMDTHFLKTFHETWTKFPLPWILGVAVTSMVRDDLGFGTRKEVGRLAPQI